MFWYIPLTRTWLDALVCTISQIPPGIGIPNQDLSSHVPHEPPIANNLRIRIAEVVANTLERDQLNALVSLCHSLAVMALRQRLSRSTLRQSLRSADYEDLAYDCIADLFQRGPDGSLLELKAYFQGIDIFTTSEPELLMHLRRMVFTKTNDGVARFFHERDPQLSRILRNIKLAIHTLQNFDLVDRFGELHLLPGMCIPCEELPSIDSSMLETTLRQLVQPEDHIPAILAALSKYLREQMEYRRLVPVLQVALAIRSLYCSTYDDVPVSHNDTHGFLQEEVSTVVRQACRDIICRTESQGRKTDSTHGQTVGHYAAAVEVCVIARMIGIDGQSPSLFSQLRSLIPTLLEEEYRSQHRSRLEYLSRLVQKRAIEVLKKDFRHQ
jgi:hypothetical protein